MTQAIATAPERPLPEGDRLAATAAMARMADADAAYWQATAAYWQAVAEAARPLVAVFREEYPELAHLVTDTGALVFSTEAAL